LPDSGTLAQNIGYQLHLVARLADHEARAALSDLELTPARVTALIHIRGNPGCDQSALGRYLMVNRSAGMKIANRLADGGLVDRRAGRDGRSKGLFVTDAGATALTRTLACLADAEARLCARLAPGERETLLGLLHKLKQTEISPPEGTIE
jgi:DNA-binding MarR family transcriptional regulator